MKSKFTLANLTITAFIFSILLIGSCSKEHSDNGSPSDELLASRISGESNSDGEIIFNDVFDNVMGPNNDVGISGTGIFSQSANSGYGGIAKPDTLPQCVTVTITHSNYPNLFPVHIVIDFGNAGCTCRDGRVRRGRIITDYTSRLLNPGAIATTTFDGYYVDSLNVMGTLTITNISTVSTAIPPPDRIFKIDVVNAKLTKPSGDYTAWTSHKTITQTDGLITPDIWQDDGFKIEGTAEGQSKKGNLLVAWQSTITDPLIKRYYCHWITKGSVKVDRVSSNANNRWEAILDFGTGTCDNLATLTINGASYNITLH